MSRRLDPNVETEFGTVDCPKWLAKETLTMLSRWGCGWYSSTPSQLTPSTVQPVPPSGAQAQGKFVLSHNRHSVIETEVVVVNLQDTKWTIVAMYIFSVMF